MEFLDIPLVDDDIAKMLVRFAIDFTVLTLIVRVVYFRNSGRKDFLFTYYMINILVFFICFTLKKYDLGLGMALGLFAIFGILRYRTDTIPIKEMTYLFMVIGVAVMNALANTKMSYAEIAFTNVTIVGMAAVLENLPMLRREMRESIMYEKIDLIKPENHRELVADLEQRTGLKISRVEFGQIDFLRDTVAIDIFYHLQDQPGSNSDDVKVTLKSQ